MQNLQNQRRSGLMGLLVLIFLFGSAWARQPWLDHGIIQLEFDGNGAKAMGMGGAFVAIANDASALAWNPAGMAQLKKPELNLTYRLNFGSFAVTPPTDKADTLRYKTSVSTQFLYNFIGAIFPFHFKNRPMMVGISVRRLTEPIFTTKWREEDFYAQSEKIVKRQTESALYALSPALSIQVNSLLYLGTTVNFLSGRYEQKTTDVRLSPTQKSEFWEQWNSKFSGTCFDLGLLIKPHHSIGIGATLSTPYDIVITNIDSSNSTGFDQKSAHSIYYHMPVRAAFGISLHPSKRVTIACDWRLNPWSQIKVELGDSLELPKQFADGHSLHVGIEYLMFSGNSTLPVRLGYTRQQQHFNDTDVKAADLLGKPVFKQTWASGFSIYIRKFCFDVTFMFDTMQYHQDIRTIFNKMMPEKTFKINQNGYRFAFSSVYYF